MSGSGKNTDDFTGPVSLTVERFAAFIRQQRQGKGLTQIELGDMAGMPGNRISNVENGEYKIGPSLDTMLRILDALDCELLVRHKE